MTIRARYLLDNFPLFAMVLRTTSVVGGTLNYIATINVNLRVDRTSTHDTLVSNLAVKLPHVLAVKLCKLKGIENLTNGDVALLTTRMSVLFTDRSRSSAFEMPYNMLVEISLHAALSPEETLLLRTQIRDGIANSVFESYASGDLSAVFVITTHSTSSSLICEYSKSAVQETWEKPFTEVRDALPLGKRFQRLFQEPILVD